MTDKEKKENAEAYKKFADKLQMTELKGEGDRIKELRKIVQEFETDYGTDIKLMSAAMQIKYKKMRREAGLPEISEIELGGLKESGEIDKTGYQIKLANTILKLGINRKNDTGGIIALSELIILLRTQTPFKDVKVKKIQNVIRKLENEGIISGMKKLDSGVEIVEFVPTSFNKDQNKILALASKNGILNLETIMTRLNWSQERVLRVLEVLENANIAKKDPSYAAGQKWYFPGFIKSE